MIWVNPRTGYMLDPRARSGDSRGLSPEAIAQRTEASGPAHERRLGQD
jgi:hypothetical protein